MKNKKRALRRHHAQRMYKRTQRFLVQQSHVLSEKQIHDRTNRAYNNRQQCSCSMCGNPRRVGWYNQNERLTMQERRELEKYFTADILDNDE